MTKRTTQQRTMTEKRRKVAAELSESLDDMMTDQQREAVIMAVMHARHPRPVPEADLIAALEWARGVCLDQTLLKLVVEGHITMDIAEGREPTFHAVNTAEIPQ